MREYGQKNLDRIREGWTSARVGRRMVWLDQTASTNTVGLDMAVAEADPDGLVVLADYQTAGRGRQGRRWLSPRGASALCSVVVVEAEVRGSGEEDVTWGDSVECAKSAKGVKGVKWVNGAEGAKGARGVEWAKGVNGANGARDVKGVGDTVETAGRLNLVAAVAACEAIADSTELRPGIKWPNDLRISGRKVGGILIESRPLDVVADRSAGGLSSRRAWIVGFGINCLQHAGHFPPELVDEATSLELAASHPVDRISVIRALLKRLDYWLSSADWRHDSSLYAKWESMAEPLGQRIVLRFQGQEYVGRTAEVDPVGGLTVRLDNGRQMWFDPMLTSVVPGA